MERSKLIEILENGSEAELTLIQNYLLDRILKKMPTETEAIERCVETSKRIKELEEEILRLKLTVSSLEAELNLEKTYSKAQTGYNSSGWTTSTSTATWTQALNNACSNGTSTTIV